MPPDPLPIRSRFIPVNVGKWALLFVVALCAWKGLGIIHAVLSTSADNGKNPVWMILLAILVLRFLLLFGLVICGASAGIAWGTRPASAPKTVTLSQIGSIAAILIAALSVLIGLILVGDEAMGSGGGGEWSGVGELMAFLICIPGGIIALLLAISLKLMKKQVRITCNVLAFVAIALPFAVEPVKRARDKKRFDQIMRSDTYQKMVKDAEERTKKKL